MWGWGYGMMGWGGALFVLLCAVLLAVLVVWLVHGPGGQRQDPPSARRILDERFASGEISEEEYRNRRQVLG